MDQHLVPIVVIIAISIIYKTGYTLYLIDNRVRVHNVGTPIQMQYDDVIIKVSFGLYDRARLCGHMEQIRNENLVNEKRDGNLDSRAKMNIIAAKKWDKALHCSGLVEPAQRQKKTPYS